MLCTEYNRLAHTETTQAPACQFNKASHGCGYSKRYARGKTVCSSLLWEGGIESARAKIQEERSPNMLMLDQKDMESP